jgi:Ca2+-binding RTX toxin-like protein
MSAGDYTILSGGGDDMHLLFTDGQVDAVLGDGNDIIGVVSGENTNSHDITGGNGEDIIALLGNGNQTVDSGEDNDVVLIGADANSAMMLGQDFYDWFTAVHPDFNALSHGTHFVHLAGGDDYLLINGERTYPGNIDPGPPYAPTQIIAGDGDDTVDVRFDHILNADFGIGDDELTLRARDLTNQDTLLGGEGIDTLILTNQGGTKTNGFVGESETWNTNEFEIFDLRDSNINFSLTNAMFASAQDNAITVTTENADVSVDLPPMYPTAGGVVYPFESGMTRGDYDAVINDMIAGQYSGFQNYLALAQGARYTAAFNDLEAYIEGFGMMVDYADATGDGSVTQSVDEVHFVFDSELQQTVDMTAMTSPPNGFTLEGGSIKDVVIGNDMTVNWNSFLRFDAPGLANSTDDTLVLDGSQTQIAASDLNVVGLERIKLQDDANNAKDWYIELNARVINQTTGNATLYIDADTEVPAGSNLYITLDPDVHNSSTNDVVIIGNANLNVFITDPGNPVLPLNEYQVKDAELFGGRDFDEGTYSITVVEGIPGGGTYYFTTNADRLTGSGLKDLFVAQTLDQVQSGDMVYGQTNFDTVQFKFAVANETTTLQDQIENVGFNSIERVEFDTVRPVSMNGIGIGYLPDLEEMATGDGSDDLRNMRQSILNTFNLNLVEGIRYELNDGNDTISFAPDYPFGNSAVTTVDGGPGYDEVILPGQTWDELAIISVEKVTGLSKGTQDQVTIVDNDQDNDGINDSNATDDLVEFFGIEEIYGSNNADNIYADSNGGNITVNGNGGDDTINVGNNTPWDVFVTGDDGNDLINVSAIDDATVIGGDGDDTINVYTQWDDVSVIGGDGNDSITVDADNDATVRGNDGDDFIDVTTRDFNGDARIWGNEGNDTINVDSNDDATVQGNEGEDSISVTTRENAEVHGGDDNDDITVVAGDNALVTGGDGDDTIDATVDDFSAIFGGDGNDEITLTGTGPGLPWVNSYIEGGSGNDLIDIDGDDAILDDGNENGSDTIGFGDLLYDSQQNEWLNTQGMDTIKGFNFEDFVFNPQDPAPFNEDFMNFDAFLKTSPFNPLSSDNLVTFTGDWDGNQTVTANTAAGPSVVVVSSMGAPDLLPGYISTNDAGTIQLNDNDRAVVVVGKNATGIGDGIDDFDVYYVVDTDNGIGSQNWTVEKVAEVKALTKVGVETVMNNLTLGLYVNDAPVITVDSATAGGFTLETSDPQDGDVWWFNAPGGPVQIKDAGDNPDLYNFATSEQGSITTTPIFGSDGFGGLIGDSNYTLVMGTSGAEDIQNSPGFPDRNVLLYGFGGNDVLRGNVGGPDFMFGGADDDKFVVVGTIGADYLGYTGGAAQLDIDLGTAGINGVIDAAELQTATADTEVVAGTVIDGEAGTDELHAFGTANLSLINNGGPLNVESLNIWSNITLTQAQLAALDTIVLEGEEPHSITITELPDGMTQQMAFEAWLDNPEQQLLTNGDDVTVGGIVYSATDIAAFDGETHTFDVGASGQDLDAGLEDSYRVEFTGEFADNNDNFILNFANGDSVDDDVLDFGTNFAGRFTGIEADGSPFDGAITPFDDDGGNPAGDGLGIAGKLVLVKGYGFDTFNGENKTEIVDVFKGTGSSGDVFNLNNGEAILFASAGNFTPGETVYMWYVNETDGNGVQESDVHLIGIVEESADAEIFWHADNFLGV